MSILYEDAIRIATVKVSWKIQPSKVRCLQRSKRKCNHTPIRHYVTSCIINRGRPPLSMHILLHYCYTSAKIIRYTMFIFFLTVVLNDFTYVWQHLLIKI